MFAQSLLLNCRNLAFVYLLIFVLVTPAIMATPLTIWCSGDTEAIVTPHISKVRTYFSADIKRRQFACAAQGGGSSAFLAVLEKENINGAAVLVYDSKDTNQVQTISWKDEKTALLDLYPLRRDIPSDEVGAEEVFSKRVGQEILRVIGGLLAMPKCPMKTCALSEHKTLKELDEKGRGLCPPCMMRAAKHVHMLKLKRAEPEKKPAEKATPGTSKEGSGE